MDDRYGEVPAPREDANLVWSDPDEKPSLPPPLWASPAPPPVPMVVCWRCSKEISAGHSRCPYCEAELPVYLPQFGGPPPAASGTGTLHPWMPEYPDDPRVDRAQSRSAVAELLREQDAAKSIFRVLILFGVLQFTTIVFYLIAHGIVEQHRAEQEVEQSLLTFTAIVEAIDAVIVLFAVALTPRIPSYPGSGEHRLAGWLAAVPLLLVALGMNLGYGWAIQHVLRFPEWFKPEAIKEKYLVWSILMICVQPAVIEELFFRYLVLGTLREVVGTHGAIWISSIMFGMAHVGNPMAIPILMIVGATFGYARVLSNSMIPPMLMHFVHNGVIVYMQQAGW